MEQMIINLSFCASERRFIDENSIDVCLVAHEAIRNEIRRIKAINEVMEAFHQGTNPVFVGEYLRVQSELARVKRAGMMETGGRKHADQCPG